MTMGVIRLWLDSSPGFSRPTRLWLDSFESESSQIWLTTHESSTTLHFTVLEYETFSALRGTRKLTRKPGLYWRFRLITTYIFFVKKLLFTFKLNSDVSEVTGNCLLCIVYFLISKWVGIFLSRIVHQNILLVRLAWWVGTTSVPGPEQLVYFSFRSVHFVRMKLQFSSIPYSPTKGHGDRSVRLVEFDQKVIQLFRPWPVHHYA